MKKFNWHAVWKDFTQDEDCTKIDPRNFPTRILMWLAEEIEIPKNIHVVDPADTGQAVIGITIKGQRINLYLEPYDI